MHERVLAEIPQSAVLRDACFSPDSTCVAFIVSDENGSTVTAANGRRSTYDHAEHLVVGNSGAVTAHRAELGKRWSVPINGTFCSDFAWVSDPYIHRDSETVAYWGMDYSQTLPDGTTGDGYWLIVNNERGPLCRAHGHNYFRPTDGEVFYEVQNKGASWVGSRLGPGPRVDWLYRLQFEPKTGVLWYWGQRDGQWWLFRDGIPVDRSDDDCLSSGPAFSEDGAHCAYYRESPAGWEVVLNGNVVGSVPETVDLVGTPVVSNTGQVAYAGHDDRGVYISLGSERGESFDAVGAPVFSPEGARLAYKARRGAKEFLVIDGKRGREYDVAWPEEGELALYLQDRPAFSSDGALVAYRAVQGQKQGVVINEEAGELFDFLIGTPRFSPSTNEVAFGAVNHQQEFALIGERRSAPYDRIWSCEDHQGISLLWTPAFSSDGLHLLFGARKGAQLIWCIV